MYASANLGGPYLSGIDANFCNHLSFSSSISARSARFTFVYTATNIEIQQSFAEIVWTFIVLDYWYAFLIQSLAELASCCNDSDNAS